jgi:hypothetical protein
MMAYIENEMVRSLFRSECKPPTDGCGGCPMDSELFKDISG